MPKTTPITTAPMIALNAIFRVFSTPSIEDHLVVAGGDEDLPHVVLELAGIREPLITTSRRWR